jgi:NhaP-type Na+/H+ or K+/H+ antiporter
MSAVVPGGQAGQSPAGHWVIAVFGIRGIGSFDWLARATTHAVFPGEDLLWATVGFVVLVSVVLHGVAATPSGVSSTARTSAPKRPEKATLRDRHTKKRSFIRTLNLGMLAERIRCRKVIGTHPHP